MEIIYTLLPGALLFGLIMVGVLWWSARSGQFDDLDGEAHRILLDEDVPDSPEAKNEVAKREEAAADKAE